MTSTPTAEAAPVSFGPYTVERELGGGGYGVAYLVTRQFEGGIAKRFCLKRIRADHGDDDARRAEFLDEARAQTLLDAHPGIVQLIDFFEDAGYANLVMEYVEGVDLARLLKHQRAQGRRLPQHVATYVAAELCSALGFAHALPQHVVHRDLAPANVFLGFDGHVKLGDFGIATFLGRTKHTNTHEVKGRIPYMSPEHFDRAQLDSQSDLFSLGSMLYEMLCDRRPFDTEHLGAAVKAITSGDFPPLHRFVPDIDPQLHALVQHMLTPRKSERVQSAAEVRRRLLALPSRPDTRDLLGVLVQQCREPVPQHEPIPTLPSSILDAMPDVQAALAVLDPERSESHVRSTSTNAVHPATSTRGVNVPGSPIGPAHSPPGPLARSTKSRRPVLLGIAAGGVLAVIAATWFAVDRARPPTGDQAKPTAAAGQAKAPAANSEPRAPAPQEVTAPASVSVPAAGSETLRAEDPAAADTGGPVAEAGEPKAAKGRHGTIDVLVHNYGWVYIDGRSHGKAPVRGISLRPGKHSVLIMDEEAGGKVLLREEILVRSGEERAVEYHVTDKR